MRAEIAVLSVLAITVAVSTFHRVAADEVAVPAARLVADGPQHVYCHVQTDVRDKGALGGFWGSGNGAKSISQDMSVTKGALQLVVDPEASVAYPCPTTGNTPSYAGVIVLLINATGKAVEFSAQDSYIAVVHEARDEDGNWRAITAMPRSWCGNSYHRVTLKPNRYWTFAAPLYAGDFETELRFRLGDVVSNSYRERINPSQFVADGAEDSVG